MHKLRRVNVFDRRSPVDQSESTSSLGFVTGGVVAADGSAWLSNSSGEIHRIDRGLKVSPWTLHPYPLIKGIRASKRHILVLGTDESGEDKYRAYHVYRNAPDGSPMPTKEMRAPGKVTAFDVSHSFAFIAMGLESGQVIVTRIGEVHPDNKQLLRTVLSGNKRPITAVKIIGSDIFACTANDVFSFNLHENGEVTVPSKQQEFLSDRIVTTVAGSVASAAQPVPETKSIVAASPLLAAPSGGLMMVGTDAAIFGFDGTKGNVLAIHAECHKKLIAGWRHYVAMVCEENVMTILVNYPGYSGQFVAYQSQSEEEISMIIGGCFDGRSVLVVSGRKNSKISEIVEKPIAEQLNLFAKKSLFELAIEVATREQQTPETLADLYRLYGESAVASGNEETALGIFCKAVELKLPIEPSVVVTRLLVDEPLSIPRCQMVAKFLFKLHSVDEGVNPAHTRLLMECCRIASLENELYKFLKDYPTGRLEISDHLPTEVLIKIAADRPDEAESVVRIIMRRNELSAIGPLLEKFPVLFDTAEELASLFPDKAPIALRMHTEFCESLESPKLPVDGPVDAVLTALELSLRAGNLEICSVLLSKAEALGRTEDAQTLVALFGATELMKQPLEKIANTGNLPADHQGMWLHALNARKSLGISDRVVSLRGRDVRAATLIDLARRNRDVSLGEVREPLLREFKNLEISISEKTARIKEDAEEIWKFRQELQDSSATKQVINPQGKQCAECRNTLLEGSIPAVFFFCGHYYHVHCATRDLDEAPSCRICAVDQTHKQRLMKQRRESTRREDELVKVLSEGGGFDVVANYLGRGLFD